LEGLPDLGLLLEIGFVKSVANFHGDKIYQSAVKISQHITSPVNTE
jgi:hypothetical protein